MNLFQENSLSRKLLIALVASLLIAGAIMLAVGFILIVTQTAKPSPAGTGAACTQEAKICPDGTAVGRTLPNCQFAACPAMTTEETAPSGYDANRYIVTETSNTACAADADCVTPPRYLMMSSCPYSSRCLNNKCAVVCPQHVSSGQ